MISDVNLLLILLKMDVSIIIVNYHTEDLIIDCIKSIIKYTVGVDFEIIVVDNSNSFDNQMLYSWFSQSVNKIKLIPAQNNLGFGKGNNLGETVASGKYLFLLNPDTYLLNNAIKILADYMDRNPEVGISGGNLFFPDGKEAPSFCMEFDNLEKEKQNSTWSGIIKKKLISKVQSKNKSNRIEEFNYSCDVLSVAYIFGADMMIRHDLFKELRGFDKDFFMYAEEEELTYRVAARGYKVINIPQAKIVHLEGAATASSESFNERQFRMRMNGKLVYFYKCFGVEGVNCFFKYRKQLYQHDLIIANIRKKVVEDTQVFRMLKILEDEYINVKNQLNF